MAGAGMLALL